MILSRRFRRSAAVLLAVAALPAAAEDGPATAEPPAAVEPAAEDLPRLAYDVELVGASGELADLIGEASRLLALQDRPPGSIAALRRRARNDQEVVREALRALGYYAGEVEVSLDEEATPPKASIVVTPGPQFLLAAFDIVSENPDRAAPPITVALDDLGIALGQPARTKDILAAQQDLITYFARRAYPLAEVVDRQVVVDHARNSVSVRLLLNTGPYSRFGRVDIRGLEGVEEGFVRNRLPWQEGEPFDLGRLEKARKNLVATNLFTSIRLTPADRLDDGGRLPVVAELRERDHRTIGGTLSYNTTQDFGIEAYWEHRNLFSAGERLRAGAFYNGLGYGVDTAFRNPDVFGVDWDLVSNLDLEDVTTEAFRTISASGALGAELRLGEHWKVSASGAFEYTVEREDGRERDYTLASLPFRATRDTTDDLLDPTRGGRLSLEVTPSYAVSGEVDDFLRLEVTDSAYFQVSTRPRIVLAGWLAVGSILNGGGLDEVPAPRRFYAGGGGSVRAYGYQMAGPVDADGDPTGGLSLLAFGGEARVKLTDTIGVVPFVEAGSVYDSRYPDFSSDLRWGAGIGLRYHTGIGPIRADVAVPFNRRDGIDDAFQVYLSFGQAF